MSGKFELKVSPSGKHMFNLKAGNGEVILTSELYESRAAAEKGIASVQKNADRILANVKMLEININDVTEILGK